MSDNSKLVQPQMVCPHCWHNFYADHAYYISRHPQAPRDSVLIITQESRRYAPHEVQRRRDGVALDPTGWEMLERACPICHLQIPPELLARRPFFLSIVGAPRSGKTYFLTSMIHWLKQELAHEFGYSLEPCDSHEVRAFQEYENRLFGHDSSELTFLEKTEEHGALYNRPLLDGVEVQLPKPFLFTSRPTEANPDGANVAMRNSSIVLYDNAGESFEPQKDKEGNVRVTQHLAESDAVLFAFDPLQDSTVRSKLRHTSKDPQLSTAAVSHRQEAILTEVIHRIRRYTGRVALKKIKSVLVVCVQKYDVWKSLLPYSRIDLGDGDLRWTIDHSSVEFSKRDGIAGLDIEEINRISLLVRSFLDDIAPQFVAAAEANFKVVRYFPLSALGVSPEYHHAEDSSKHLMVKSGDIQPFRVTHPMLWLFRRWGLIRGWKKPNQDSQRFPHMISKGMVDEKMRLANSKTGRILTLDKEYAGGTIIDPSSGDILWIPELELPDDTQIDFTPVTPPSPPPRPKAVDPTYKLPTTQPPKKGWFRK